MKRFLITTALLTTATVGLSGCWLGAGAVGAEGAYIASQEKRTAGQTIDDQVILTSLKTRMLADPEVSGLNINVDVFKGIVQLRGYVKTQTEINRAIALAQSVEGVRSVESRLVLD
jgi:hyperosmotically inducible periplasmic protein